MANNISDNQFQSEVLDSENLVLVDFWAEWCGPCRMISPIIDEISKEIADLKVVKINIDESPNTPTNYGVRGIPTLMLFKDGKPVSTTVGALPKNSIIEWVNEHKK